MKYKILLEENIEEDIIIYARQRTPLINKLEELITEEEFIILGYSENETIRLSLSQISVFITESGKIFAITDEGKLQIKYRLYQLEKKLPGGFIKINQSCIANISQIEKFTVSPYGTLTVKFKNGYTDYVSRRNIKKVKERLGFKNE